MKEQAKDYVNSVFDLLPELDGQPENFWKPQRGGNAFKKVRINNINNFLNKLEKTIDDENLMYADDDEEEILQQQSVFPIYRNTPCKAN
jgi:hypothetical protein